MTLRKLFLVSCAIVVLGLLAWKSIAPLNESRKSGHEANIASGSGSPGKGTKDENGAGNPSGKAMNANSGSAAFESKPVTGSVESGTNRMKDFRSLDYKPVTYSGGIPRYDGEAVIAYVAVPSSGEKLAMTVNQMGEYPRVRVQASERVKVLLQFTNLPEGTPVSFVAQDGGLMENNKAGLARQTDVQKQVAFEYQLSANDGVHRVHVTTATGEAKTLDFWVGPENVMATK